MTTRLMIPAALLALACNPDAEEEATNFSVTIEHVGSHYDFVARGAFDTPDEAEAAGPAGPGSGYSFTIHAGPGDRLSFVSMFAQSNDLFVGPGGEGIALYDDQGQPRSGDLTDDVDYWDAGTEVDQEPGVGVDQAPRQSGPDTGAADMDDTVRLADDAFGNLPLIEDLVAVTLVHVDGDEFEIHLDNISEAGDLSTSAGSTDAVITPGVWAVHAEADALFAVGSSAPVGLEMLAEDGDPSTLLADVGARTGLNTPFAPGAWLVHDGSMPLFEAGVADMGEGLEALAEDGDPSGLADSLGAGVFDTPDGAEAAGVLLPGQSYSFEFEALPGDHLSLATMLVQSNDLFVGAEAIELFDDMDQARSADVSAELSLWDAGTELNQFPGTGWDQAPRQAMAGAGIAESAVVQVVSDGFDYPAVAELVEVRIEVME